MKLQALYVTRKTQDTRLGAMGTSKKNLTWIQEILDVFQVAASIAYEGTGRGAIVVDTTIQPHPESGHPFAHFSQDQIEEDEDEDVKRLVRAYDPEREFVVILLKEKDRTSTYRIQPVKRN